MVELLIVSFENSSPNKMKSEISSLSSVFLYFQSVALNKALTKISAFVFDSTAELISENRPRTA